MSSVKSLKFLIIKICKIVLNIVTLILYRVGFRDNVDGTGGIGGTWNLNEEKNADAEIVASGVLIGFLVYTIVQTISDCFRPEENDNRQLTDVLMSFVGIFMWFAIGGAALHYWMGYKAEENYYWETYSEKKIGLALGSLCIVNGVVYFVDTTFAVIDYYRENS